MVDVEDIVEDVAVGGKQVEIAIEVGVEKLGAKPEEGQRRKAHPGGKGRHRKETPFAPIERIRLGLEIGHRQIEYAVAVVVAPIYPHARFHLPILTISHPGQSRPFGEGPVVAVVVEEVAHGIVGHVDVGPTVAVVVAKNHS